MTVTSNGARANCLAAASPPKPAPMITKRGRACGGAIRGRSAHGLFANADHDVGFDQERAVDGNIELRIGGGRGVESRGDRASLRERADEGMAGGRKAADFDLEERPCHQGTLGAPSADPNGLVLWLFSQIVTMGKRDATRKIEGCSTRRSSAARDGKAWAPIGRASAAYLALPRATSRSAMSATYSIDAALPWPLRKLGNASQ